MSGTTGSTFASTWVSAPSPLDTAASDGYSVAWIDLADGTRVQAFVAGDARPEIGTMGVLTYDESAGAYIFSPERGA